MKLLKTYWGSLSKSATGDVLQKRCFEKFAKFTGKSLYQSLFFNKAAGFQRLRIYNLVLYLIRKKQIFTNSLKRHAIIFNLLSANPKLVNSQLIV